MMKARYIYKAKFKILLMQLIDLTIYQIKAENLSMKYVLARSCFQLWPKIGDEGDKIETFPS